MPVSRTGEVVITLRLILTDPPPGVAFRVQRGRDQLLEPVRETKDAVVFELPLRAQPGPRFLGEYAQGPPAARFVYVNCGRYAGQETMGFDRRAKIPLGAIPSELVERAAKNEGAVIETTFSARMKDGTPVCATVQALSPWRLTVAQ